MQSKPWHAAASGLRVCTVHSPGCGGVLVLGLVLTRACRHSGVPLLPSFSLLVLCPKDRAPKIISCVFTTFILLAPAKMARMYAEFTLTLEDWGIAFVV